MIIKFLPALCMALTPLLLSGAAVANEAVQQPAHSLASIDARLKEKGAEIDNVDEKLSIEKGEINSLNNQRADLKKESIKLDKKRKHAQVSLDQQYKRMIEDPELDISAYQQQYQDAWKAVKENQVATLTLEQSIEEHQRLYKTSSIKKRHLQDDLENIHESRQEARVLRIRNELNSSDTMQLSHTIACDTSLTLAQCANQGKTLTMQRAVNKFQSGLINSLSESDLAKQNLANVELNVHVMDSNVLESGFSGHNRYATTIQAEMKLRSVSIAACQLLGLENRYCISSSNGTTLKASNQKEKRWVSVTIRSNRHDDKVTVNGVSYGSTPVDVMLPVGLHQVTVEKSSFEPYSRQLMFGKNLTVWADLKQQKNRPKQGRKFADTLKNKNEALEMVVINGGEYHVGPQAQQQITLKKAYSISSTPVTVKQFDLFVLQTGYVTESEKNRGCQAITNGTSTLLQNQNWRQPGFEQQANSPAVCIARKDAEKYVNWLSKQTGYKYALPTEAQWEVAARAGSPDDFWWGNEIGAGNANTGWGGSSWSNKSTSPVASFAANPYGLYDTTGNVWEWTSAASGVVRGGSWSFAPSKAKVYERLELQPETSANFTGFRVVREL